MAKLQRWTNILAYLVLIVVEIKTVFSIRSRKNLLQNLLHYSASIFELESLEQLDRKIYQALKQAPKFKTNFSFPLEIQQLVDLYLEDFLDSNGYYTGNYSFRQERGILSKNPICTYRLLSRVKKLLVPLISKPEFLNGTESHLAITLREFLAPTNRDVEHLAENILRIQHVYDLDPYLLADGTVSNIRTNCSLKSVHCYEIAQVALKTEQFVYAIQWLEIAKEKSLLDQQLRLDQLDATLWDTIEKHNEEFDEEIKLFAEPIFFDRLITHEPSDSKNAKTLRKIQYEASKGRKQDPDSIFINYWGLCAGENFQTDEQKSHLFCWYEFKMDWVFAIAPVKIEFLSRNPEILQFYQVLKTSEIKELLAFCGPEVKVTEPTHVISYQDASIGLGVPRPHTSFSHSYADSVQCPSKRCRKLEKKLEWLTGLETVGTDSSKIRLLSYTVGAHLVPHFDRSRLSDPENTTRPPPELEYTTNRDLFSYSSMMLYLSDVELGGGTVFTSVGVNAYPIKGSAVFWYNFRNDGTPDFDTYHGGCPVVLGSKWALNVWTKYGHQYMREKCSLTKGERLRFPVNQGM